MPPPDPPPRYLTRTQLAERRALRRRDLRRRRVAAAAIVAVAAAVVLVWTQAGGSTHMRSRRPVARRNPNPVRLRRRAPRPARGGSGNRSIDRVLAYTSYLSVGAGRHRDIALTFDDGPGPYTPQVLAVLARYHVPATFFAVGSAVQKSPRLVREESSRGYPIGDHTEHHAYLGHSGPAAQEAEISGAGTALEHAGVPAPRLFRPPYGSFNASTLSILRANRMLMVLWTVDTKDFSRPGTQRIIYTALSGARPGAVILMHDGGVARAQTVAALPRIIQMLRRRGYRFVTVP